MLNVNSQCLSKKIEVSISVKMQDTLHEAKANHILFCAIIFHLHSPHSSPFYTKLQSKAETDWSFLRLHINFV